MIKLINHLISSSSINNLSIKKRDIKYNIRDIKTDRIETDGLKIYVKQEGVEKQTKQQNKNIALLVFIYFNKKEEKSSIDDLISLKNDLYQYYSK